MAAMSRSLAFPKMRLDFTALLTVEGDPSVLDMPPRPLFDKDPMRGKEEEEGETAGVRLFVDS